MKQLQMDGVVYDQETVASIIEEVIKIRDEALLQNCFGPSVTLSHAIAVLNNHKSQLAPKMEILKITRMKEAGCLRGFFDIDVKGTVIRDCRIIQQPNQQAYCTGPQVQHSEDKRAWKTIVSFSPELRQKIQDLVLPKAASMNIIKG